MTSSRRSAVGFVMRTTIALLTVTISLSASMALSDNFQASPSDYLLTPSSSLPSASAVGRSHRRRRSSYSSGSDIASRTNVMPRENLFATVAGENQKESYDTAVTGDNDVDNSIDEKRGRWSKNNVQIWGKRSASPSRMPGHAVSLRSSFRAPSVWSRAAGEGSWSKRKKTWEKNNFKMWGKRADDGGVWNDDDTVSDSEAYGNRRRLVAALLARDLNEKEREKAQTADIGNEIERLFKTWNPKASIDRFGPTESGSIPNDDDDDDVDITFPVPVVDRPRMLWSKRGNWASNNVRMWG